MATLVEVVTTGKPKVTDMTLKISASDARDLQTYISVYYQYHGYGRGYEKNNGLHKLLQRALEGKTDKDAYPF